MMGTLQPNEAAFKEAVAPLAASSAGQQVGSTCQLSALATFIAAASWHRWPGPQFLLAWQQITWHNPIQGAPALGAPAQQTAGTASLPSISQPNGQAALQQLQPAAQPLLQLTMAPHDGDGSAAAAAASPNRAPAAMLPPPELAGEEFLGLPPPFGGLPFPSGVLPEGPMGLVMQAFASDRPLTPAEYEQLKAAQQVCCRVLGAHWQLK